MEVSREQELVVAVGAGVVVGIVVAALGMALIGALTGGGDTNQLAGQTIDVGGEIQAVNATNDTLVIDTPRSSGAPAKLDISRTGPVVCTTDGEFTCQPGAGWRSVEPGRRVCATVGIPETGAPVARDVFINATCTASGVGGSGDTTA